MELGGEISSCSSFLKAELANRQHRNAAYSLRAFARDLEVSPSRLSEIIGNDSKISPATAAKITKKLNLSQNVGQYFVDLAIASTARSPLRKQLAETRIEQFRQTQQVNELSTTDFKLIRSWYHLAIMELVKLKDFTSSAEWIAGKLGLTEGQVVRALSALEEVGLIAFDEEENLIVVHDRSRVQSEQPSGAIRHFHKEMIDRARRAIDDQSVAERDLGAMVVAVPSQSNGRIKELLAELRREFVSQLQDCDGEPDSVYALTMQWTKLTK